MGVCWLWDHEYSAFDVFRILGPYLTGKAMDDYISHRLKNLPKEHR